MNRTFSVITIFVAALSLVVASCMDNGEDIPDFQQQLQMDIAAIDNYLAANNVTNAIEHSTGIRYVIHYDSVGGVQPTLDSCVTANYKGLLMSNGQTFDNGTGISFPLAGVIDGWKIGIPLLNEGDSATLYIPSGYAYGYYGYPPEIPKNANLIFHVGIKNVATTYKNTTNGAGSCN